MLWDDVVRAMVALLQGDSVLTTQLAATVADKRIGPLEEGEERRIPSVRYSIISDTESENFNAIIVQIDYWAVGRAKAVAIEARLRSLLSRRTRRMLGGVDMETTYEDSRDMGDPKPGVVHRSLDFRFVPLRQRTHS